MGKFFISLISLIAGLIVGGGAALMLGGGGMMGIGVATGLSSGICATVEAAQGLGLLTAEQVDRVLIQAAENLANSSTLSSESPIVGSASKCAEVMQNLRARQ